MGLRRQARELALQFLFSRDMQGLLVVPADEREAAFADFERLFLGEEAVAAGGRSAVPYARTLVNGVCDHLAGLDEAIAARSRNWRLERMSVVDRNILRIAAWELRWAGDAPARVVINEALEIAKRYSIADSVAFINGVLDALHAPLSPESSPE